MKGVLQCRNLFGLSLVTLIPIYLLAVCSACSYLPTSVMWHPQKSDIFALGKK